MLQEIHACILIPTYNNAKTLKNVLTRVLAVASAENVIVVDDGTTDGTLDILKGFKDRITVLHNETNQGKGFSLRKGFRYALEQGYKYAITIDSDGQHAPEDIHKLVDAVKENPGAVIMGSRNMKQEGIPGKSSFGNRFSNFWFMVETWNSLPDTQTGFRAYPLEPMRRMKFFTKKFEFEIEVIVRLAWKGLKFIPVPVSVKYDYEERVSHFRPGRDFFRISVLNSVLVIIALLYYYPMKVFSKDTVRLIKAEAIKPQESNLRKALSLGFGVFMGIFPIWGFQLMIGIPLAVVLRLNKVLFIAAANISIPPMIPFIIYTSLLFGQLFMAGEIDSTAIFSLKLEDLGQNFYQYVVGATLLSVTAFIVVFLISFGLFSIFRKNPVTVADK